MPLHGACSPARRLFPATLILPDVVVLCLSFRLPTWSIIQWQDCCLVPWRAKVGAWPHHPARGARCVRVSQRALVLRARVSAMCLIIPDRCISTSDPDSERKPLCLRLLCTYLKMGLMAFLDQGHIKQCC